MAYVKFTDNLKRHLDCPEQIADGQTLAQVLDNLFRENHRLSTYILDDQARLRKHILISIDNELINDRIHLTDPVKPDSHIYILQALSGG